MALYRAFSYGRFRCSGAMPKVSVVDYQREGYALVIRKGTAKKFCLRCIKDFFSNKGLRAREDENYLTIHSI